MNETVIPAKTRICCDVESGHRVQSGIANYPPLRVLCVVRGSDGRTTEILTARYHALNKGRRLRMLETSSRVHTVSQRSRARFLPRMGAMR